MIEKTRHIINNIYDNNNVLFHYAKIFGVIFHLFHIFWFIRNRFLYYLSLFSSRSVYIIACSRDFVRVIIDFFNIAQYSDCTALDVKYSTIQNIGNWQWNKSNCQSRLF